MDEKTGEGGADMAAKYQFLADQLREELRRNGGHAGYKLPTEQELARQYQLSRQTVRHTLRLLEEEGLIQRRQGSGSYATGLLPGAPPRQIAVVASFLDDYIFPAILRDASDVFSRQGYSTAVYATENCVSTEREILLRLLEEPVSGLLVEGAKTALPTPNADLYQRLRQAGTPIVFLHGAYAGLEHIPCVADNNYGGGYQLARYLAEKGHREIAGLFKSDDIQGHLRYHGAVSAIRDMGRPIRDSRFAWYDTEDRRRLFKEQDRCVLKSFLQKRLGDATAVICYNDEIAYHLIQALLESGRRVPEDVAVVSFDNSYLSQLGPVPITSLSHRSRMGRTAAEQMSDLLRGETVRSKFLEWELVIRNSG
jgi:GntR family transcriptional regulator of arabinose operon